MQSGSYMHDDHKNLGLSPQSFSSSVSSMSHLMSLSLIFPPAK